MHWLRSTSLAVSLTCILALLLAPISGNAQSPSPTSARDPSDISLAAGYSIEPAVLNLSVPTTAIFDGDDLLIAESGFANTAPARIVRIRSDGSTEIVVEQGLQPPVTGLLLVDDQLYISHRGRVSKLEPDGSLSDIVTDLPSYGDHQNNNLIRGSDGKIYLAQGTVTNSGVVGEDNFAFGWLTQYPELHDVPCQDITLRGQNFTTTNPLTDQIGDVVSTGAYQPFGTPSQDGQTILGNTKCNGAILRFNPDGTDLEVVAWGLRNPFGLALDPSGQLWATYHGADVRGSRLIYNDPDYLVQVQEGAWYGWPDFFAGESVEAERFQPPAQEQPLPLWQEHPPLAQPHMQFDTHSGINGIAFSDNESFGYAGHAFIALFGTFAPVTTGPNIAPNGFKVVRADVNSKEVFDFAANIRPGPAFLNFTGGFNRPSDVVFGPDEALYVIDWGAEAFDAEGVKFAPGTGAVWRIYNRVTQTPRFTEPVVVQAQEVPLADREPVAKTSVAIVKPLALYITMLVVGLVALVVVIAVVVRKVQRP